LAKAGYLVTPTIMAWFSAKAGTQANATTTPSKWRCILFITGFPLGTVFFIPPKNDVDLY
jgi:hypothetical protein